MDPLAYAPQVWVSDLDKALISVLNNEYLWIFHLLCLHHLSGNLPCNLSSKLGIDSKRFLREIWTMHHAELEVRFLEQFQRLCEAYLAAASYMRSELLPDFKQWAEHSVLSRFTAGIRTKSHVETESKQSKGLGSGKTFLRQPFDNLRTRSERQHNREVEPRPLVSGLPR